MPNSLFFYKVTQNQNFMSHKYKYINRVTLDKMKMTSELRKALEELKDDFKCQLEYIEEIQNGQFVEENLDYLINDNSTLNYGNIVDSRNRPCQILQDFSNNLKGDQN